MQRLVHVDGQRLGAVLAVVVLAVVGRQALHVHVRDVTPGQVQVATYKSKSKTEVRIKIRGGKKGKELLPAPEEGGEADAVPCRGGPDGFHLVLAISINIHHVILALRGS